MVFYLLACCLLFIIIIIICYTMNVEPMIKVSFFNVEGTNFILYTSTNNCLDLD